MSHTPVLKKEVIERLNPKPNENFIDCTVGGGGHAREILEKNGPEGKVLGIDWDKGSLESLEKEFKEQGIKRIILVNDNFANLGSIVEAKKFTDVSGVLIDLGMSSLHVDESGRGFTFRKNEPLDMRYGLENPLTAEKILNFWSGSEIEKILKEYGEESFAKEIAREIISERSQSPISSTFQLVKIIEKVIPKRYQYQKIHFATRTFQALRIAVNGELENLKKVLPSALKILIPGGRLVVISFHSLEDRIVKNFFREKAKEDALELITKKPIRPKFEEIKINPRSRSSRLRVVIKK